MIVLVALIVLLGLPLGMPMAGTAMCPDCALGSWSAICIALIASIILLVPWPRTRRLEDRSGQPLLVAVDVLEPPPRLPS